MNKKLRKTLYLPSWLCLILDDESNKYDGPGVVAAAAIYHFSTRNKRDKVNLLSEYRAKEILFAYEDES